MFSIALSSLRLSSRLGFGFSGSKKIQMYPLPHFYTFHWIFVIKIIAAKAPKTIADRNGDISLGIHTMSRKVGKTFINGQSTV